MTEVKADYSTNYWETVAKQERQKAEANLRLAAERASEIAELKKELKDKDKLLNDIMSMLVEIRNKVAQDLPEEPFRYVETMEQLRKTVGKYFDGVDAMEYVNRIRGGE